MSSAPLNLSWTDGAYRRFDRITAIVGARRKGLSLTQLADAATLARELDQEELDQGLVEAMAKRLELTDEEIEGIQ